jgi:REP element-mobilizing transposase RayT
MSTGYQITNQYGLYFVTFTVVDWVDIFSRKIYRDIVIVSLKHCIEHKGLKIYGYVIMTNHLHLIIQGAQGNLSGIIRDFKKFTSVKILDAIKEEPESRREWLLHRFAWNAAQRTANSHFQLWTHSNHAEELFSHPFFLQKLNYLHQNPVRAGWVEKEEDWCYSSAGVFYGKTNLLPLSHWHE